MDLSRITIKPRIRNAHESIDLGLIMARKWWKPLFLSWLIPSFIVYFALSVIFIENHWAAILITWWLKPLWDRAPLYIASQKIFNEDVQFKEILKKLPKLYSNDIFAWLLWRRFSFTRSFDMPVTVLESQKHSARRKRLDTLHQNSSNAASWLTIVCIHLEMIVTIGVLGFFMFLIPDEIDIGFMSLMLDEEVIVTVVTNTLTFLSMALIAPFYTMAGFALYINRRIKLEAWDIEIRFRHMAKIHSDKRAYTTLALIFISCFFLLTTPDNSYATSDEVFTPEKSSLMIKEILKGDDFHKKKIITGWRLKDVNEDKDSDEEVPQWIIALIKLLEYLFDSEDSKDGENDFNAAKILEALLWIIVIAVVVYSIYRVLKYLDVITPGKRKTKLSNPPAPDILFGLDVRKKSIPKDVTKQTMILWQQGLHREGIGLLYRSTLSLLIHKFLFEFYQGYTEQECSDIVQQSDDLNLRKFVEQITSIWQSIAYAHSIPPDLEIESLCEQWSEVSKHEK